MWFASLSSSCSWRNCRCGCEATRLTFGRNSRAGVLLPTEAEKLTLRAPALVACCSLPRAQRALAISEENTAPVALRASMPSFFDGESPRLLVF